MSVAFELLRFEAAPASATVALVELDGVFDGPAPARVRLLVERAGAALEVPALGAAGTDPWTAAFAVELAALDDADFSLVPGRGPLIALPSPTLGDAGDDDRFVRLARQANELRHRLGEAVAASAARERLGAELAEERSELQAEVERLTARLEQAEATAQAARDQRDSSSATAEAAREELAALRERLRETDGRATEAERDRAALRARAEAAERSVAQLREAQEPAEERLREAEARAVAAEDEVRTIRRDLKDSRARVEALLREQRHPAPARRGHEVPSDEAETTALPTRAEAEAEAAEAEADDAAAETAVIATTDADAEAPPAPENGAAHSITRRTKVVKIAGDTDDVLPPERVGAGYIKPAETPTPLLTPARIMVAVALLLLVAALVAIALGAGIV